MILKEILKILRKKNGYSQEQIAKKVFVSIQAVSKWENGQSVPSIDNLLLLSDIYGISLDNLVSGSPFFKKPYIVGNKFSFKKGILYLFIWTLSSLFLTGFGYQPFYIFLIVLTIGLILVLPELFDDYWIININDLSIKKYSKNDFRKISQLLFYPEEEKIKYSDITNVEIIYKPKARISPFDIGFDNFYLKLRTKDKNYRLELDYSGAKILPQFINYIERHNVDVYDKNNVIELLIKGESLYEYFNQRIN
ncbi:helix-turn-helix domain-containing protein [Xylocopilactobacillus apicola]|uniref:Transcriptional regulator n=1 Tax=Xylocopilactobacillus apicola TaxID=2932184 RepID=A0AAU9DR95_9LACO|nr:helix-turn-helix domain-containing protein [Xylocopilactobacillus apicola]BDR57683.1 transcriptional regulator [Xylocopilactobacillus apicola]